MPASDLPELGHASPEAMARSFPSEAARAWNLRLKEHAAERRDELAERVSIHGSLTQAAREMGISQQRASQMWKIIRAGLGWQAR